MSLRRACGAPERETGLEEQGMTAEPAAVEGAIESLRSRFQRGVLWSMAAAVATSGFNFIFNIVIARLLGRDIFGQFGMVQTTIATVAGIAQLATGYTATKYVAEFRSKDPDRAGRVIALCAAVSLATSCVAAIGLYAGAPWLAAISLKAPALTPALRLAAILVFFTVLIGYQLGTLAGLESYRVIAILALVTGVANLIAAGAGAHYWGLAGAIGGLGLGSAVQWLAFRFATHAECAKAGIRIPLQAFWSERAMFLSFALPAALSGFSSMPALWLSNAFLARQPGGFAQMGLYTAALNLRTLVFFLPTLVNRVSMSLLNNQKGMGDWRGYRRVFTANVLVTAASVVLGGAMVAIVGVRVLLIFGKDFTAGYPVLLLVLLSALPEALAMAIVQVVHSQARLWLSFFVIALPKDCSLILFAYLLTGRFGAAGLATAYAAAWTITIGTVYFSARSSWPEEAHDQTLPL